MKDSGNTMRRAPWLVASAISRQAFSTVASRSKNTGEAWTAAILNLSLGVGIFGLLGIFSWMRNYILKPGRSKLLGLPPGSILTHDWECKFQDCKPGPQ